MSNGQPPAKWRARGSSLGYYMQCSFRAAFDRALYENALDLPPDLLAQIEAAKASSPYADLGTCIHHVTQTMLDCAWPAGAGEPPTPEQHVNAAHLFADSVVRAAAAIDAAAKLGHAAIKSKYPGVHWIAERSVKRPWVTGHIDLLSDDRKILLDIKTTSRPPDGAHIKPEHLVQTLAYVQALEEQDKCPGQVEELAVLYVDSLNASWWCLATVDPRTDAMIEYRNMIRARARHLQTKSYMATATPNVGPACANWCPYTSLCRDRYQVPKGDIKRVNLAPKVGASNPLARAP